MSELAAGMAPVAPAPPQRSTTVQGSDAALLDLARSARERAGAFEGAAVQSSDGASYVGVTVELPALSLSALRAAVGSAAAAGAPALTAAAVVSEADVVPADDLTAVLDLSAPGTPVYLADADGTVREKRLAAG